MCLTDLVSNSYELLRNTCVQRGSHIKVETVIFAKLTLETISVMVERLTDYQF